MWTATIISKQKIEDKIRIVVELTDGKQVLPKEYYLDNSVTNLEWVKNQLVNEVKRLTDLAKTNTDLVVGATIDLTPPVVQSPTLTAEELARDVFLQDAERLRQMKRAIDLGLKKDTDTDFVDLFFKVKAEFKTEYLEYL